LFSQRITGSR